MIKKPFEADGLVDTGLFVGFWLSPAALYDYQIMLFNTIYTLGELALVSGGFYTYLSQLISPA